MKMWLTLSLSLLLLVTACGPIAPAKPNIQQGNEITEQEVNRVRIGMTKEQVAAAVGSPVLLNIFRQDEWNYVYTTQSEGHPFKEKLVAIHFDSNRVTSIDRKDY